MEKSTILNHIYGNGRMGNRVYYKRSAIDSALISLKQKIKQNEKH